MRMKLPVVAALVLACAGASRGQTLTPCLPPQCVVLPLPPPNKPVSDIIPGSQIVPPPVVPFVVPSFAVQPIAPPSPLSLAPSPAYVPLQPTQFVPQPMVIPQFTPDNTNNALAATMIAGQQQAQQAYANGVQLAVQRQQLQMQMGDYARRNGCTWYKQHWYSTPVCVPNTPAPSLQMQQIEEARAQIAERQKQLQVASQEQWAQKLQVARTVHPDWDEVASRPQVQAMVFSTDVMMAIKELPNGAEVMYYFATHPDAYTKVRIMVPALELLEIHRISDELGDPAK